MVLLGRNGRFHRGDVFGADTEIIQVGRIARALDAKRTACTKV